MSWDLKGLKGLLSVYPTWVSGYCPTSLGSYNSLLSSPYFYVQKFVGTSNTIAGMEVLLLLEAGSDVHVVSKSIQRHGSRYYCNKVTMPI